MIRSRNIDYKIETELREIFYNTPSNNPIPQHTQTTNSYTHNISLRHTHALSHTHQHTHPTHEHTHTQSLSFSLTYTPLLNFVELENYF